jgi:hypothetical protein
MAERSSRETAVAWDTYRQAAAIFLHGATLSSASRIALVVGTWLSLINQGDAIFDGRPPWFKIALNYTTPFVVASLGFLAGRRRRNIEQLAKLLDEPPPAPDP